MTHVPEIVKPDDWYKTLLEECRSLVVEARTMSHWTVICAYHQIGSAINSYKESFKEKGIYGEEISKRVGKAIGINRQYIYDAQKFADMFPDLSRFPGDKAMSWFKCRQMYLMSPEQKEKDKKEKKCPNCGFKL
jgi:hypothetical protein